MSGLINREALKEKKTILWDEALGFQECVLMDDIDGAPAVDAVEAVRCKDCEFICPGNACPVCTNWGRNTDYGGWCYMGERREENAAD